MLRRGKQAVVQLQSRGAAALVLPRMDQGCAAEKMPASAFYDGGQSIADAGDPKALPAALQRCVLPAVCAWTVDGGGGPRLRLLRHGEGAACAGGAVGAVVHFLRLRDGQSGVIRALGPERRRVVPDRGVLLRLPARGTADDGRGIRAGAAGAGRAETDRGGDRRSFGGELSGGTPAGGLERPEGGQRRSGGHPQDGGCAQEREDRDLRPLHRLPAGDGAL